MPGSLAGHLFWDWYTAGVAVTICRMNPLTLVAIFFLASFAQSVSGFAFGLVTMGLLGGLLDLTIASPLVSLLGIVVQIGVLLRYHQSFNFRAVVRLAAGTVIGVPIGVWLLGRADQPIVLHVLGAILVGYALYGLFNLRLPRIAHPALAYPFGVVSGILSGLYNIGGPPVVIYATCSDWSPAEFRSNLQGFFFVSNTLTIAAHFAGHHFTEAVFINAALALPAVVAGMAAGFVFDRHLMNPALFRKIVFIVLALIGLRLLV